jgi:hypothetical protein
LEAAFDYSKKAPLILLSGYQTPDTIRRVGTTRLTAWLKKRGCRGSATVAGKAVDAANAQHTVLRTEAIGAQLVAQLAQQIAVIDAAIAQLDGQSASDSTSTPMRRSCSACPDSAPYWRRRSSPTPAAI